MKLLLVCVGHKMPDWITAGFNEYARRMPRTMRVELKEIKPAPRSGGGEGMVRQWLAAEAECIRAELPAACFKIVLDESGQLGTTRELAQRIQRCQHGGLDMAFVIGSADGTARELQAQADWLLALSRMTLPHGLCRVILAEQLYRATTLLAGHPYHRA